MTQGKRNIRLDLEYDGTGYAGWAKQPGLRTIEGTLEEVLGRILQQEVRLSVAGRTDAGVHARGQVASFKASTDMEPGRLRWSANGLLPDTIAISGVSDAPPGFDARHSAVSRRYSYSLLLRPWPSAFRHRFLTHVRGGLDLELMRAAAAVIAGRHDFRAFTPTVTEHDSFEREISLSRWRREGDLFIYDIEAGGFLRGMVRALVGTMLEIGRGVRPPDDMPRLLEGGHRPEAGETAPAAGLCLQEVRY
jgi:tRNA pseudouridine38-40 synthase